MTELVSLWAKGKGCEMNFRQYEYAGVQAGLHIPPDIGVAKKIKMGQNLLAVPACEDAAYPPVHPDIPPANLFCLPFNGDSLQIIIKP